MTDSDSRPLVTPFRVIVAALLILLGLAGVIGVALMNQPHDITLTVSGPAGEEVFCDLVIDGRAESHIDTAPVTYTFRGHQFAFAVVPVESSAGQVTIDLKTGHGSGGSATSDGATGSFKGNGWMSATNFGGMSSRHIATMRMAAQARQSESPGPE